MANFHFDISADVVRQLGEELVTDEVTALLELVKNAYDADADYVNVVIDTNTNVYDDDILKNTPNGYITIEDNGIGMSLEDIYKGWLVISVSRKRAMKQRGEVTQLRKRTPMGDKGLGRLSAQRLGHTLDMLTSQEGLPYKYLVSFDWRDFNNQALLKDVNVSVSEFQAEQANRGTKLIITDLKDPSVWSGASRQSIQNKLSQLISPFDDARAFQIYLTINGEVIELSKIANRIRQAAASTYRFAYFSKQLLHIEGAIKLNKLKGNSTDTDIYHRIVGADYGQEFYNFLTDPSNKFNLQGMKYVGRDGWFVTFSQDILLDDIVGLRAAEFMGEYILADPGSFAGEIDDFKLRPDEITDSVFDKTSEYVEFVKRQIGIRIFRDGFGIRPYGYQGDDWLKLSSNQTSGSSFYGLRPNNVIGFVSLRGDLNGNLKEKTDREGFVDNDYSRNFFRIMETVRDRINTFIESIRRGYIAYREVRATEELGLGSQSFAESLQLIETTSQEAAQVEQQIGDMAAAVASTEAAITQISNIINNQPSSAVAVTNAEVNPILANMQRSLAQANSIVKSTKILLPKIRRLDEVAQVLGPKIIRLEEQINDFTELASLGLVAEGFTHELATISDNLDHRTKTVEQSAKPQFANSKELRLYIEYVRTSVASIRRQLSHLAPSLRYVREKQENIHLRAFLKDLLSFYRGSNPTVSFNMIEPFDDFTIRVNKGKITQIIDNLVLNSLYWLKHYAQRTASFKPEINFSANDDTLVIWDNGLGIDKTVEYSLFQSFVTTKPKSEGRGLGLFIVTQLLDTINSEIILLPERNIHGRRFKFGIILKGALHHG